MRSILRMALPSRVVEPLEHLLTRQEGVLSRAQARDHGLSDAAIRARIEGRRWQRVYEGVYATFTGPLPLRTRVWAAVLYAGSGAVASHDTAATLHGLRVVRDAPLHVTVPAFRRVLAPRDVPDTLRVVVHRSTVLEHTRHPAALPPRTRLEDTVVDQVDAALAVDDALAVVADACQRRLTTPARLAETMARRLCFRWRSQLRSALADIATGAHSLLELRYLRDVERPHGLPTGERQGVVRQGRGKEYRDVLYLPEGVGVELDGRVGHGEIEERWRDLGRDNAAVVRDEPRLHYGWHDVLARPCDVAVQVVRVLRRHGWTGRPRACGPNCPLRKAAGAA